MTKRNVDLKYYKNKRTNNNIKLRAFRNKRKTNENRKKLEKCICNTQVIIT